MKALSLTQPWADVILEQGKRVENRTKWTACKYRGPVLLHAASGLGTRAAISETLKLVAGAGVPTAWIGERFETCATHAGAVYYRPRPALHRGGIVGRAEIVGVIDPMQLPRGIVSGRAFADWVDRASGVGSDVRSEREAQRRWWFGGFALVLDKVEPLTFYPCKGALGLWELPFVGPKADPRIERWERENFATLYPALSRVLATPVQS